MKRPSLRSRKSILHRIRALPEAEFVPFDSLVETEIALVLTTIVSIALAAVIVAGAFA